jgi:hypothetical protein
VPASTSPPYVVRPSPTHGRGVFATRTIRKGARIVEYRGSRLAPGAADKRPASNAADPYHTLMFKLHDGTVIDSLRGTLRDGLTTAVIRIVRRLNTIRAVFIWRSARSRSEELRYDYRLQYEGRISRPAQRVHLSLRARRAAAPCCGQITPEEQMRLRAQASRSKRLARPAAR